MSLDISIVLVACLVTFVLGHYFGYKQCNKEAEKQRQMTNRYVGHLEHRLQGMGIKTDGLISMYPEMQSISINELMTEALQVEIERRKEENASTQGDKDDS